MQLKVCVGLLKILHFGGDLNQTSLSYMELQRTNHTGRYTSILPAKFCFYSLPPNSNSQLVFDLVTAEYLPSWQYLGGKC